MPQQQLESIIQRMIDADESEENIASVIKEYNEPGNIDLFAQPSVDNPKGGKSTVFSRSYNIDGKEVLLPSVTSSGRFLESDDEILSEFKKTGKHLGKFKSPEEATKYAEQLHKDYESGKYSKLPQKISEPTDFGGGFMKSAFGGEALETGLEGAGGFLRGALTDLPSSILEGLKTAGRLITSPIEESTNIFNNLKELPGQVAETTRMAGSDPEAFGRMVGQVTGQPLATAGLGRAIPKIPNVAGSAMQTSGKLMQRYQPLSGMLPRIIEGRTMRNIERFAGRKLEEAGNIFRDSVKPAKVVEKPIDEKITRLEKLTEKAKKEDITTKEFKTGQKLFKEVTKEVEKQTIPELDVPKKKEFVNPFLKKESTKNFVNARTEKMRKLAEKSKAARQ